MMPYRPEQFVEVAEALQALGIPQGEGRYRTITGRAYYGAFWATCEALCANQHINPPVSFYHEPLCDTLAKYPGDEHVREYGNLLNSLRQQRVHADYKLRNGHDEDTSDDAIADARHLLAMLPTVAAQFPRITPPPPRS